MNTKYVVLYERMCDGRGDPIEHEGKFVDVEVIYIFPSNIVHRDFANKIVPRSRWRGAGFVSKQVDGKHFCHGKSESMGVASRPEDNVLLNILLGE